MIITTGLSRKFGDKTAVKDLDLEVKEGEVFGFVGPNGAGKTTTVRMLCCLIAPTRGRAFIDDLEVGKEPDSTRIRGLIGLLPEVPGLNDSLTAHQILDFYGRLYRVEAGKREKNIKVILSMLDIWDQRDRMVGTFSKGMKQKVAIARALVHEPKYIFLDEPTAALDPVAAKTVRDFILELKKGGKTVFITTHNLAEAERICDRVAIFKKRVVEVGTPRGLARKLFSRRTFVELAGRDDGGWKGLPPVLEALEGIRSVDLSGRTLDIDVDDPERRNPAIVSALVAAGAKVNTVSEKQFSLEDVYLKVMGKKMEDMHVPKAEPTVEAGGRGLWSIRGLGRSGGGG